MPRRTFAALQEFGETWATRGIRAWEEGWWELPVTIGSLVGSIIGAAPGEVVMQQNVSICQWIVASCFDWRGPRNKLVTDGLNFTSNDYIYHGLERQGARVCSVASADEGMTLELEDMLAAIDEQTQLVSSPTSHSVARMCRIWPRSPSVRTKSARISLPTSISPPASSPSMFALSIWILRRVVP